MKLEDVADELRALAYQLEKSQRDLEKKIEPRENWELVFRVKSRTKSEMEHLFGGIDFKSVTEADIGNPAGNDCWTYVGGRTVWFDYMRLRREGEDG